MCGICGFFGIEDKKLLKAMCDILAHRGPDDSGIFLGTNVGLGNRRLSIIDVAGGHQPIHNEDESIWIVFNGEIYNYILLRDFLEKKGHKFCTNSDTEAIVHLYEEFGDACVNKLRGMFAFAIWNQNTKELLLARDRLGIKPLYYTLFDGNLIFASEIKVILLYEEIVRKVNHKALYYYLSLRYTPAPETLFENIKKLPPGHILKFRNNEVKISQYWDFDLIPFGEKPEEFFSKKMEELLEESVEMRLMSEVPLGVFLSGGLDSSSIVAIITKKLDRELKTFSVSFKGTQYDESQYARAIAEQFSTDHYEIDLSSKILDSLPKVVWHFDDLVADPTVLAIHGLSNFAKKYVTVVLTGDGGDEIFGGYHKYHLVKKGALVSHMVPQFISKNIMQSVDNFVSKFILEGSSVPVRKFKDSIRFIHLTDVERYLMDSVFSDAEKEKVIKKSLCIQEKTPEFFKSCFKHSLNPWFYADMKFLLPDRFLMKIDKMTMANSLEARVPFLDQNLAEFSLKVPYQIKSKSKTYKKMSKPLLRTIMGKILPKTSLYKKQTGFVIPIKLWYDTHLRDIFSNILLNSESRSPYFNHSAIRKLIRNIDTHKKWRLPKVEKLWILLNFEIWHKMFIEMNISRWPNLHLDDFA